METPIYITGAGQTPFGEHWDMSLQDLLENAMNAAIEDSGGTALDIDTIVVGNMLGEVTSEQAHLGALASSLLPHHPPALRAEAACASGAVALHTACALIESGKAKTVLVVGAEKMTDTPADQIAAALMGAGDSQKDAPCGLTFPGIFGLIANRYMHDYSLTREQLNTVSAAHHKNAVENPFAQFRKAIPAEAISASPKVADPLCMLDCSPISDGAAAVILSSEAKEESDLKLVASQIATDALSITERPTLTSFAATKDAFGAALQEADITPGDIAHLELHDCFSIAAVISLEDMGYAEPGSGVTLYEHHADMTINSSGGLKACGHPVAATGIKQLIDVCKQLRHSGSRYGATQNFGGACATCAIHIVENEVTA